MSRALRYPPSHVFYVSTFVDCSTRGLAVSPNLLKAAHNESTCHARPLKHCPVLIPLCDFDLVSDSEPLANICTERVSPKHWAVFYEKGQCRTEACIRTETKLTHSRIHATRPRKLLQRICSVCLIVSFTCLIAVKNNRMSSTSTHRTTSHRMAHLISMELHLAQFAVTSKRKFSPACKPAQKSSSHGSNMSAWEATTTFGLSGLMSNGLSSEAPTIF